MSSRTQSVLVVEDEASIASFVAAYLKNAGYTVRTTASGTAVGVSIAVTISLRRSRCLSRVSVRFGNSPTVRMPSGLMILPKLVRRRA